MDKGVCQSLKVLKVFGVVGQLVRFSPVSLLTVHNQNEVLNTLTDTESQEAGP